jgi:hypothetical protein
VVEAKAAQAEANRAARFALATPARCAAAVSRSVHPAARSPDQPGLRGQGVPASNDPGAFPSLRIVGHAREQPAQLDGSRQLALLLERGADRGGLSLGDNEHAGRMVTPSLGSRHSDGQAAAAPRAPY